MSQNQDTSLPVLPEGEGSRFARARHILLYFVLAVIAVWLLSGFYQVKAGEVALVERLGQFVGSEGRAIRIGSGLHYHLPWPIDRVHIVSTQQEFRLPVQLFNSAPAEYEEFKRTKLNEGRWNSEQINALYNPYLITGDKNVVHLELVVQFQIDDPQAWLQSVSHDFRTTYDVNAKGDLRNQLFQKIVQRAMVERVGSMSLEQIVRAERARLKEVLTVDLDKAMAKEFSAAGGTTPMRLGVKVTQVEILEARVPDAVLPAYQNLITLSNRAEETRLRADSDRKSMGLQADGEKTTLLLNAQQYANSQKQAARGDASRFEQILVQYEAAPFVTRLNLYSDAVNTVLQGAKRIVFTKGSVKIVVDPPVMDPNQVLPGGAPGAPAGQPGRGP